MSFTFQPNSESSNLNVTSKTMNGNNTTTTVPIFRIIGNVRCLLLYGQVTTVLGANHTGVYIRFNDQTNQSDITLSTVGRTLSAAPTGSLIIKQDVATALLAFGSSATEIVNDNLVTRTPQFSLISKPSVNNDIEYIYTTTDAPTSGVIQFFLQWIPLSANASVTSL